MAEQGSASAFGKGAHLTKRELEVLRLLCDRKCYLEKVMPEMLGMKPKTFETHRYNLYKALNVHSRQELYIAAVRYGLVPCLCGKAGGMG